MCENHLKIPIGMNCLRTNTLKLVLDYFLQFFETLLGFIENKLKKGTKLGFIKSFETQT
jgi:hypothetical protein